jgi:hypothetical protein
MGRPVLVSTSRHITQGIVDVVEEKWDGKMNVLSGRSKVVGGDAYELRIFAPEGKQWKVGSANVSEKDRKAGVTTESKQDGQEIRVTIANGENREVAWEVGFTKQS